MADHKAAATNFLNALERIPKLIEQFKTQNGTLERDLPTLREVVNSTWKKEDELKQLKLEVSALERKIQLTLPSSQQERQTAEKIQEVVSSPTPIGNNPLNTSQSENSQMQFIHEHVIVTRPAPIENRDSKRMKI